jgi:hypothetical protein
MRADIGHGGIRGIKEQYPWYVCILRRDVTAGDQGEVSEVFLQCLIAGVDKVVDFFAVDRVRRVDVMTEVADVGAIYKEIVSLVIEDCVVSEGETDDL